MYFVYGQFFKLIIIIIFLLGIFIEFSRLNTFEAYFFNIRQVYKSIEKWCLTNIHIEDKWSS